MEGEGEGAADEAEAEENETGRGICAPPEDFLGSERWVRTKSREFVYHHLDDLSATSATLSKSKSAISTVLTRSDSKSPPSILFPRRRQRVPALRNSSCLSARGSPKFLTRSTISFRILCVRYVHLRRETAYISTSNRASAVVISKFGRFCTEAEGLWRRLSKSILQDRESVRDRTPEHETLALAVLSGPGSRGRDEGIPRYARLKRGVSRSHVPTRSQTTSSQASCCLHSRSEAPRFYLYPSRLSPLPPLAPALNPPVSPQPHAPKSPDRSSPSTHPVPDYSHLPIHALYDTYSSSARPPRPSFSSRLSPRTFSQSPG